MIIDNPLPGFTLRINFGWSLLSRERIGSAVVLMVSMESARRLKEESDAPQP